VKPCAVEHIVQGQIAGVNIRGIVDLLDVGGYWRECEREFDGRVTE
jgi:hypothetical protein